MNKTALSVGIVFILVAVLFYGVGMSIHSDLEPGDDFDSIREKNRLSDAVMSGAVFVGFIGFLILIYGLLTDENKNENPSMEQIGITVNSYPEPKPPPLEQAVVICPTCHKPLRYIDQFHRWWCDNCNKYI